MKKILEQIRLGFRQGFVPKLTKDGSSGAYMLRNQNKVNVAIFKPIDEEAFAPNNPRDLLGHFGDQALRTGVLSGESCIREVVAYLLDKKHYSKVPYTTFAEVIHRNMKYNEFSGIDVTTSEY